MTVIGRDTDSPFRTVPDPERVDQHRPPVDDKTMRRLRTPFATQSTLGEPNPQGTAALDHNDPYGERPDRRPRRSGDRG
ncbi:MAG: hypothetical protein QOE51_4376 [Actinoplanes sp.]|jgi:hypothetical protein|nr:hypothetical protein [Actinoplanes sp.]